MSQKTAPTNGADFFTRCNINAEGRQICCDAEICDCAAGTYQSFALAANGIVCGMEKTSACGQGKHFNSDTPVVSLLGIQIRRLFAGAKHSITIKHPFPQSKMQ